MASVRDLQVVVATFNRERGWTTSHHPQAVLVALTAEVGELCQGFLFDHQRASADATGKEMAGQDRLDQLTTWEHEYLIYVANGSRSIRMLRDLRDEIDMGRVWLQIPTKLFSKHESPLRGVVGILRIRSSGGRVV